MTEPIDEKMSFAVMKVVESFTEEEMLHCMEVMRTQGFDAFTACVRECWARRTMAELAQKEGVEPEDPTPS